MDVYKGDENMPEIQNHLVHTLFNSGLLVMSKSL